MHRFLIVIEHAGSQGQFQQFRLRIDQQIHEGQMAHRGSGLGTA